MESKDTVKHTLSRLRGQLEGIARMVDEERDLLDIVAQIRAVSSGLGTLSKQLVQQHLQRCCVKKQSERALSDEVVEIMTIFFRM